MRFNPAFGPLADPSVPGFLERLDALRTELVDLAFALERRGRLDAADVAVAISIRLAEWRDQSSAIHPASALCFSSGLESGGERGGELPSP